MISLPIILSDDYTLLIKKGEKVTKGQKLAEKNSRKEEIINISGQLAIPVKKAAKLLKKNPGDNIEKGDILAVKSGTFGMSELKIISAVNGTVVRYERDTGDLVIESSYNDLTGNIISPVDGTITLCDNRQIVIDTDKNVVACIKGTGEKSEGEIVIRKETGDELIFSLNSDVIDKIILGKEFNREALMKGIAIGALGIIGTDIIDEDLEYLNEKKNKVPVVVVEDNIHKKLSQTHGNKIFLDGVAKAIILI